MFDRWIVLFLFEKDFGDKVAKIRAAGKSFGEDKDCSFEAKVSQLNIAVHHEYVCE